MKLTYLKLADDSVIINLPSGPHTINPRTVGYKQIVKALDLGISLAELLHLLSPPLPNGIFYAYAVGTRLLISQIALNQDGLYYTDGETTTVLPPHRVFLGAYASKEDLLDNHPEYLL